MNPDPLQYQYLYILVFMVGGGVLAGGGIMTAALLSPKKPDAVKQSTYECGQEPLGPAWVQYNVRYYLFAMVFVLFDVEIVFLAPWAVAFKGMLVHSDMGVMVLLEMILFLFFILLALVYAWRKGVLEWT